MGIADAGTAMTLHSAAPATILIASACTGDLLLWLPVPEKARQPRTRLDGIRTLAGGRSRSVEDQHTAMRRARLRWRRSPRAGGGSAAAPLAWPPARSAGALGGEIEGGNRERAGGTSQENNGRTVCYHFATQLGSTE